MQVVKGLWDSYEERGADAWFEAMLTHCHQDVEVRPYIAGGRTFQGVDELREFFREREAAGATVHASPWSFEETGDAVVVAGSIRVQRPDGSIADAQLRWTFGFRDGLIDRAEFAPLAAAFAS